MMNIKKIIREEIDKFLITENISSLGQYANGLENIARTIGNNVQMNGLHPNVNRFLNGYIAYILQIKFAIQRCIQANSLNEYGYGRRVLSNFRLPSLRDMGINIPTEMGGNFWRDAKDGYNGVKNFLRGNRNGNYGNYNRNGYDRANRNTLSSVKLSVLLSKSREWETSYAQISRRYQLSQYIQNQCGRDVVQDGFNTIEQLKQEYRQLKNAQGTNP